MANGTYGEKRKAKADKAYSSLASMGVDKSTLNLMSTGQLIRKGKQAGRVATKSVGLKNQTDKQKLQNAKNELNKQDVRNTMEVVKEARTALQTQQKAKMDVQGYGDKKGKGDAKASNINAATENLKPLVSVEKSSSPSSSPVNQNVNVNYNNSATNQNNSNKRAEKNFTNKGLIGGKGLSSPGTPTPKKDNPVSTVMRKGIIGLFN